MVKVSYAVSQVLCTEALGSGVVVLIVYGQIPQDVLVSLDVLGVVRLAWEFLLAFPAETLL
jgi:hypothetical protein